MAATQTARKSTKTTTTARTAQKRTAAQKARTAQTAPKKPSTTPLLDREPKAVIEDAGYALAGVSADALNFARSLPERLEALRLEATKAAEHTPERVKGLRTEAPAKVRSTVAETRDRLVKDIEAWLKSLEHVLDVKAGDGRKVADTIRRDQRVKKVLDQAGNTRKQVKAAVTSIRRTAEVAGEAGREQAGTARSQTKAAATSATKTAQAAAEAVSDN